MIATKTARLRGFMQNLTRVPTPASTLMRRTAKTQVQVHPRLRCSNSLLPALRRPSNLRQHQHQHPDQKQCMRTIKYEVQHSMIGRWMECSSPFRGVVPLLLLVPAAHRAKVGLEAAHPGQSSPEERWMPTLLRLIATVIAKRCRL